VVEVVEVVVADQVVKVEEQRLLVLILEVEEEVMVQLEEQVLVAKADTLWLNN
jgi:hypothetical protein